MSARLKLNFFSPLPPVLSNIANYTSHVVAELQSLADVTVWTAQPQTPEFGDSVAIQRFTPNDIPWKRLQQADLNIYNLGNNATFHRAIFDVARAAPGLIVLHDTRLQHFFGHYSETPGPDRTYYLDSIRRWHGAEGLSDAHAFLAGEQAFDDLVDRYPMTLAALEGSLGAIIHNEADRQILAGQTRTPLFYLPLAYSGPGAAERRRPGGTLQLIVFGFIGTNRRLSAILDALAGHSDPDIQLNIYGAVDDAPAVEAQIAALGLQDRVRQHGFVPDAALTAALAHADLALNLRFPTMGEASGSQLRIWDAGLSSLVTRIGWYAALPEDAVFFVEPEREVAMIRDHLTALRRDPDRFRRAGERGREILRTQHSPAVYAGHLVAIAAQAKALHARRQAVSLSHVAAQTLLEIGDIPGIHLCAERIAAAVHDLTSPA